MLAKFDMNIFGDNPPLPLQGGDGSCTNLQGADEHAKGLQAFTYDLPVIAEMAAENEEENEQFRLFLTHKDGERIDEIVFRLNTQVSAAVDCTMCGNCCRSLMINILPREVEDVAAFLQMPAPDFKEAFVEESEQGQLIMKSIPCHFLENNKCSIYDHRFQECRQFPHLHKAGFINRLFGTFMHYGRCPIIFNVIELLKTELSFRLRAEMEGEL